METAAFSALIQQARTGDETAVAQLVRDFDPVLRRQIRMTLTDPWLRRTCDTSDLLQSVLGDFFVRLAAGQFELGRPENLAKLLNTMAVNRIRNLARAAKAKERVAQPLLHPSTLYSSPGDQIARQELVARVRELLSDEERQVADLRTSGLSWEEVANQVGGTAESIRKQFSRAMNRVGLHFDVDDVDL